MDALPPLDELLAPGRLYPVYQPLVRLVDGVVTAHEGLIRVDLQPGLPPTSLFDAARRAGRLAEAELRAAQVVIEGYGFRPGCGRLMINFSATALMDPRLAVERIAALLDEARVDPAEVLIELCERDVVEDLAVLIEPARRLRALGIQLALDDFGSGHSNFSLWQALGPEYVKLDRSLIHGMSQNLRQLAIVRALVQVAAEFGTDLSAEGIELADDLALVCELGIRCAQGYLLARPEREPRTALPGVTMAGRRPLLPSSAPVIPAREVLIGHLRVVAPALRPDHSNEEVAGCFHASERLHALAVLNQGRPIGLINRRVFMERFGQPYARELFGKKSCTAFMHPEPLVCEATTPVSALLDVLRGQDQRYLGDGFIITENGEYAGLGTGESLVRRVSELRIEAARYANPLTLLPGNLPLTQQIEHLLADGVPFVVAYADLNHFKPFNDQYGYFRGDEMIKLLAQNLRAHADPRTDFLGHVGGDDFVVLFRSVDWRERCRAMVAGFNAAAVGLFDAEDVARGGIEAEDRQGRIGFFPLTTLSIGVVLVAAGTEANPEQVASSAALAKRRAKQQGLAFVEVDYPPV